MRRPRQLLSRLNAYGRRQRRLLHESNHPRHDPSDLGSTTEYGSGPATELRSEPGTQPAHTGAEAGGGADPSAASTAARGPGPVRLGLDMGVGMGVGRDMGGDMGTEPEGVTSFARPGIPFGLAGRPFDRHSPFYLGFLATLGGVIAWTLLQLLGRLTTTMTLLIVAFFFTLALDPIVQYLTGRGLHRALAVLLVFAGVVVVAGLLISLVVPPVIREGSALLAQAPDYLGRLLQTTWVQDLDQHYGVVETAQEELEKRIRDGSLVGQVFGGVLGAGRFVVSGVFQFITVLILTLYFLAALPRIKQAAYAAVPASRRPRITSLSEEIMRRTGAYAAGQASVATVNALLSYVMMRILEIPYASVLAVVVGLFGLIPMIGATIGAAVVATVAFFDAPRTALIVVVYYVVYQQLENYVVVPRIMKSTVSVPGAVTIVAALAGGALLGVLGALLAIPVAAGLLLIYEEVLLPRQARH